MCVNTLAHFWTFADTYGSRCDKYKFSIRTNIRINLYKKIIWTNIQIYLYKKSIRTNIRIYSYKKNYTNIIQTNICIGTFAGTPGFVFILKYLFYVLVFVFDKICICICSFNLWCVGTRWLTSEPSQAHLETKLLLHHI